MKHYRIKIGLAILIAALMVISPWAANRVMAAEVGQVISLKPGVTAQRNGQQVALEISSRVHDTDTLLTDATGRVQILFDDDSTVSLSSNSSLSLQSVVPTGGKPEFKAHLGQGLARFITGKIVENNPDGFTLTAPEATIGIRGTIFAVESMDGRTTTVYIFSAETRGVTGDVLVNSMPIAGGFKITLPGGQPQQMTTEDWNGVINVTQARGGATEVAEGEAAASETTQAAETAQVETASASTSGFESVAGMANAIQPETKVQTLEKLTELAEETTGPGNEGPGVVPNYNAHVSGTLASNHVPGLFQGTNSFSFDVNLNPNDGQVSNATMRQYLFDSSSSPIRYNYDLINGSGVVSNGSAEIGNFQGRPTSSFTIDGVTSDPASGLNASMNVEGLNSGHGGSVVGSYEVGSGVPSSVPDSGSLSGTINVTP